MKTIFGLVLSFLLVAAVGYTQNQNNNPNYPAILPSELGGLQIFTMKVGDSGFASPMAMEVDLGGQCYLDARYELDHGKDISVGWIRIEKKVDGYYVYAKITDHTKWVRKYIPNKFDRLNDERLFPVRKVIIVK